MHSQPPLVLPRPGALSPPVVQGGMSPCAAVRSSIATASPSDSVGGVMHVSTGRTGRRIGSAYGGDGHGEGRRAPAPQVRRHLAGSNRATRWPAPRSYARTPSDRYAPSSRWERELDALASDVE